MSGKTIKSPAEKIFSKMQDLENSVTILKNELFSLSPEELSKFQSLKKSVDNKENLSPLQIRLIKIVKESDENLVKALSNVINGLLSVRNVKKEG